MIRGRISRPIAMLAVTALSVGLVACGGDEDSGGEGGGDAEQILRVAPGVPPVSLDPHGENSAEEGVQTVVQNMLDPLVRLEDGEFVPMLAESWETPDDTTWVFQLRDDVEFHDGTPLTAEDVKASADRLIKLEGPLFPLWESVESIEATDKHTVTINTKQPLGTVLSVVSFLFVGPADRVDDDSFWLEPVGTGPFKFQEFVPDERVVMTTNDDYWGGAPKLDRLEFQYIPEISSRITALETGEIDFMTGVPPDQVESVQNADGIVYESGPSFTYYFNWFNSSRKPFDDARVRQAMWHALDVESAARDLFGDQATVAKGPVPQNVFGAAEMPPYEYNPERARELLKEAGHPNGFETTIQYMKDDTTLRNLAQTFISDWAEIGVTVKPLEKERAKWIEDLNALKWDMNLQGNSVATGDADYTLGRLYTCAANRNGYCNKDLDKLLLDARSSLEPAEREQLYADAAQIIWEDAVGIFPMDLANNVAYRDRVEGFKLTPNGRARFHDVSVTGEAGGGY